MDKKTVFPIILVFMTVISIYFLIDSRESTDDACNGFILKARQAAENNILVDAEKYYQKAYELKPSLGLLLEIGNMYMEKGDQDDAMYWYERNIKEQYPRDPEAYAFGMRAAIFCKRDNKAFQIYDELKDRKLVSAEAEKLYEQIQYSFSLTERFDEVGSFGNNSGMAAVKTDEKWGYIDTDGSSQVYAEYSKAGIMSDIAPVVSMEGEPYFIDNQGNRKINALFYEEKDPSFGKITEFIGVSENLVLASNGDKVAFFDKESGEPKFIKYKDATLIGNGVYAATKDGTFWALIGNDGKEITDYKYHEILSDAKNNPCRTKVVIVKENDVYYLLDLEGKEVNGARYREAYAFNENSLAAVKKDNKWIFVDENGDEKTFGDYQDARSFSDGLAAVEMKNMWGYIDNKGNIVIEPQFVAAEPISGLGCGFVKTDLGKWSLIRLYSQNHDE